MMRQNQSGETGCSKTRLNSQGTAQQASNPRAEADSGKQDVNPAEFKEEGESRVSENRIEAHIDWLQFVGHMDAGKLYPLFDKVKELTKEKILLRSGERTSIGYLEFKNSGRSPNSVRLGWENQDDNGKCYCLISIPGNVLSAMPMKVVHELAKEIVLAGLHCTRLDDAMDDWGKRLKLIDILVACEKKNYAKFRKTPRFIGTFDGAWTIYFGSRESARSAKIYNKEAQPNSKIKAYRLEVKFGSKLAHQVLLEWLSIDPDELGEAWEKESARYLMQSAVGSIDFIDRENNPNEKNLSRIPRLSWWQAFIDLIEGQIYHTAPTPELSLQRTTKWHLRQVMRSLVCVLTAFGEDSQDWFRNQIETARASLNERHINLIDQFKREYAEYKDNPLSMEHVNFSY